MTRDMLTVKDIAVLTGLSVATVRTYRARGVLPVESGYVGNVPWWPRATIEEWWAGRRRPGRPAQ